MFCSLQIPLVEQHYATEFLPFLKLAYKVERVSGDSQLKISFVDTVRKNDVIICTAQILENYLERSRTGEDEGVNLSGMPFHALTSSPLRGSRVRRSVYSGLQKHECSKLSLRGRNGARGTPDFSPEDT